MPPNSVFEAIRARLRAASTSLAKAYARSKRHRPERAAIVASGLFDEAFYRTQATFEGDALAHYLTTGAREGLRPHPLFDTRYYRKRYPDVGNSLKNAFAHYLMEGGREGRSPNPYFDGKLYAQQEPALPADENPLVHYVRSGHREGRSTSHAFDAAYYVSRYPDVGESSEPPLSHYLRVGAKEGRSPSAAGPIVGTGYRKASSPSTPDESEWNHARLHRPGTASVDIIVPVFRGYAETLRCLHRVLTAPTSVPFELVVVDDCSPEPELTRALVDLSSRGLFTYLRNDENRGFVGTVNRGMALHADRDVVLLNSDAEVYGDWLDRMRAHALADPSIGTITPFSNSATICSYPVFPEDNDMELELAYDELDKLAAKLGGDPVDLPTGVGFCFWISRACLDATGAFDEARFGKGYGEENDFCRRALAKGFRSVLAPNVFVRHTGGASFQGEKAERVERALETLRALYPEYEPEVARFIEDDPIRAHRERLDLARLRRTLGSRALVFVSHGVGGGTEQHVRDLAAMCAREGVGSLILRTDELAPRALHVELAVNAPFPNLPTLALDEPAIATRLLEATGVRHVHVHHLLGLEGDAPAWVRAIARSGAVTVDYTVHDYSPICPRINLIDASRVYCGEPPVTTCESCVGKLGSPYAVASVSAHRANYRAMLGAVRRVFVPSADVRDRLRRHFPELEPVVMPHAEPDVHRPARAPFSPGDVLRVVVLGGVGDHKGFEVLAACAEDIGRRRLPIELLVVGYTRDDARMRRLGVTITGAYASNDEAFATLERLRAHACFFPAVWPETYSYTLSMALAAELHPIAFAFGAIAERLRRADAGTLLPVELVRNAPAVNDALVRLAGSELPPPAPREARTYRVRDYYDDRV